jgi:N-methylhydantoinase B
LFQIGFGGIPGRPLGDGPDGHSLWPGFTNVPNEFLERYFPMMIERYSTEPDSGGAGLHRGGNGIHMTYRFLSAGTIAIHDDRWFVPPWGVNGGDPGKRARKILEKADGTTQIVGNKVEDLAVEAGDQLHFITWGGGGWGDPLERDPALVGKEIVQGLVTPQGARAYGVVADARGEVDEAATQALRADMRAQRAAPCRCSTPGRGLMPCALPARRKPGCRRPSRRCGRKQKRRSDHEQRCIAGYPRRRTGPVAGRAVLRPVAGRHGGRRHQGGTAGNGRPDARLGPGQRKGAVGSDRAQQALG